MKLALASPPGFSLKAVIYSHGWSVLPPFLIDDDDEGLSVALRWRPYRAFILSMRQRGRKLVVRTHPEVGAGDAAFRARVRTTVRSMLRLDEDLSDLYRTMQNHGRLRWVPRLGAGRILRAPTAFEDTVKMICTTNCSWELTTLMVRRLTESLGDRVDGRFTFPSPAAMARKPERFYRNVIRAGYRSPYLREFAQRVADGELDLERLRHARASAEDVAAALSTVKGVGPYASDNLLRLHGRYDTFAHDSWIRAQYGRIYHNGKKVSDRTIERRYREFGEWKGLVYWLDMTRPWYEDNFEFQDEKMGA